MINNYEIKLFKLSADFEQIKQIWNQLSVVNGAPYFFSWGWIENWITSLPENSKIKLAVILEKDIPVMAFFLGETKVIRKNIFKSKGLFLNTTGNPIYDELCIEYNSIPCAALHKFSLKDLVAYLPCDWEEFTMPALDADSFPGNCLNTTIHPYKIIIEREEPSQYVDLEFIRKKKVDYLALLSSNTRSQIKRTYRELEPNGPVAVRAAVDIDDAMDIFEEMIKLHQKTWQVRGKTGAFASSYFYKFHKDLIQKRFKYGEIQLLKIASGNLTIGCLYNFVFNGKVYFYQSGINYEINKQLKPGLICHVEAIKHNISLGNSIYDFLGGSERYKTSLATNKRNLIWAKVQKPKVKFWVENRLRAIRNFVN